MVEDRPHDARGGVQGTVFVICFLHAMSSVISHVTYDASLQRLRTVRFENATQLNVK